jgi:hypothetical protein
LDNKTEVRNDISVIELDQCADFVTESFVFCRRKLSKAFYCDLPVSFPFCEAIDLNSATTIAGQDSDEFK